MVLVKKLDAIGFHYPNSTSVFSQLILQRAPCFLWFFFHFLYSCYTIPRFPTTLLFFRLFPCELTGPFFSSVSVPMVSTYPTLIPDCWIVLVTGYISILPVRTSKFELNYSNLLIPRISWIQGYLCSSSFKFPNMRWNWQFEFEDLL